LPRLLIRNVDTHFEDRHPVASGDAPGTGSPILLVHGILVSAREWDDVTPLLARRHRVIAPDLPGFGRSGKPADFPYGRVGYCDHLVALLDALGLEKVTVVGHSMGGGIAAELAARSPERVDKLVLLDAHCYPLDLDLKARLPLIPVLGRIIFTKLYGRSLFRDYFKKDVWNGAGPPTWDRVDRFYDEFSPPEAREAAYRVLCATVDVAPLAALLPSVKAPTLVLWGEDDRLIPPRLGERLSRAIPGARLELIRGACHAVNEQFPEQVADRILAFVG
jgi:pimeloyl-ACP methyl ester carboxylesterase